VGNLARANPPVPAQPSAQRGVRPKIYLGLVSRLPAADQALQAISALSGQTGWLLGAPGFVLELHPQLALTTMATDSPGDGLNAWAPAQGMAEPEATPVTTTVPAAVRNNTFPAEFAQRPTIRCWSHCMRILRRSSMATITGPPGVSGHLRAVTPRRFQPPEIRCPQPNPVPRAGPERCAGPGRPVQSDCFRRHQRGRRGRCDVWLGAVYALSIYGTSTTSSGPSFGKPATATAMAGPFRVRRRLPRAGAGMQPQRRWPNALLPRR